MFICKFNYSQEVVADETPAIQVVLAADYRREKLLKERDELEASMDKKGKNVDMDRLQDVYDELKAIDAEKAEPKARRFVISYILFILFNYKIK